MSGSLMVTISGIRGIIGDTFTPQVVLKYVSAFATLLNKRGGTIVVGRDSRVSGPWVLNIVHGVLQASGYNVVDVGVVPTPTVQYLVKNRRYDGGIIVTSSHNDVMWNGLKFVDAPDGLFLSPSRCNEMFALADAGKFYSADYKTIGKLTFDDTGADEHIEAVLKLPYIHRDQISQKKYRVVLDSVNGAGGPIMKKLLETFGCQVIGLNLEPTGLFSHAPEPIPENLGDLCQRVSQEKADFGIAVDPDVDRCVLIDENGRPLGEEYTLALAVEFFLGKCGKRTKIVKNLSSSRAVDDIATKYGCETVAAAVGEINVANEMERVESQLGGEGNGGVMLTEVHIGRDALVAASLTLAHLSTFSGSLSQLKSTLPQYDIVKLKVSVQGIDAEEVLKTFREEWEGKSKLNTIDGLHITTDDWWVHLRKSNTEPIIRVIGEAKGGVKASTDICNQFMDRVKNMAK
ncbi:hypothetical protein PROFUN_05861 [Planoprotostelium fungivorum]|uniref:Phosphoglucosamine mutase n=1 Tax=Planoprotostelium fungivorum TaxID=1890364 RepID=A0A2P6NKS2_9EUKA|nr:hypothetical protein PROFUN_05861 [Planoprotostelium fungivorum]